MRKKMIGLFATCSLVVLLNSCFYGPRAHYYPPRADYGYGYNYRYAPRPYIRVVPPPMVFAPRYNYHGHRSYGGYGGVGGRRR